MEPDLELKEHSTSNKAQTTSQIEAEAICLEVKAEALENEARDPNSF